MFENEGGLQRIRAENLTKIFGGKKALDSVSVNIGDGSIYGLVGSNGSGKSTLLRLASGVYMADGGSITSDGEKIFDNPKDQIAHCLPRRYALFHAECHNKGNG